MRMGLGSRKTMELNQMNNTSTNTSTKDINMTTPATFTFKYSDQSRIAFHHAHRIECRVPCSTFMGADLDNAEITQHNDIIIKTERNNPNGADTYTLGNVWTVSAPSALNGEMRTVTTMGNAKCQFDTHAEAVKFLAKVRNMRAKEIAKRDNSGKAATEARRVCSLNPYMTTETVLKGTDPAVRIGSLVVFHGMGKKRVGVVVDKTPTKWVVAYTTPSNSRQIRQSKINRI
jgi:hypothetical protein